MINKRKSDRISVNIHENKIILYIPMLTFFHNDFDSSFNDEFFSDSKLSRSSRKKSKATIKRDNRLIIDLLSLIMKYIINIILIRVEEHEHNFLQFSFNVTFVKSDRVNKQSFKSRFSASCSQELNDSLFSFNNTAANNRSSRINNIFYVEFNFLL